jgi:hypothetical protein
VAGSAALMVVVGLLVAFAGSASAAPVAPAGSATVAWAYGGSNSSSGTVTIGHDTASWNVSVGVAVIFNATPTVANTTELEAQRTISVNIALSLSTSNSSLAYSFQALEVDTAYANITNASLVDAGGIMVPALGIDNSSFHGTASLSEALVAHTNGTTESAYLNVSAAGKAMIEFAPALGLIPLNLTGISTWNSTANATPAASWNVSYNYALHGVNNTTASGSATKNGSWDASGPIDLNGQVYSVGLPLFRDHAPRLAIVLVVHGPADIYDGFIIVPHGFDLFGGGPQAYGNDSLSNVSISSDVLFLNKEHSRATSLTASELAVGGTKGSVPLLVSSRAASSAPAASNVGTTVVAQPESVSAAQSQSHCMQFGCSSAGPWFSGLVAAAVIGGLIAAVAGTVGVVEWRSYARRKNRTTQLVGGYSEGMVSGLPPTVAQPPAPPQSPLSGPSDNEGPTRPL